MKISTQPYVGRYLAVRPSFPQKVQNSTASLAKWSLSFGFLLFVMLLPGFHSALHAQCTNSSFYPGGAINGGTGTTVTIATDTWEGEYSQITSITAGASYQFAFNLTGGYITVRTGSYDGTVVASGVTPLTVIAPNSSDLYVHWNTNASCGIDFVDRTSTVRRTAVAAAPTITSFSPSTVCTGGTVTITGTNLSGATAVTIGGTAVSSITSNSATQIVAVVGSGTTGVVRVTTPGGSVNSSGSLTVNATPTVYNVGGGSDFCAGASSLAITLSGSQSGVQYQLYRGASTVGGSVNGTGSALNFGTQSTAGTYTVVATRTSTSCTSNMNGSRTINMLPVPQGTFTGGTICSGATGQLTFTSSVSGMNGPFTIVYNDGTANRTRTGVTSGTPFNVFTNPTTNTTYTLVSVTSTAPGNSCGRLSGFTNNSATITINALPTDKTIGGTATICAGSSTNITVASSQSGVNYQLRNNTGNVVVGSAVAGNGGTINLSTGNLSSTTTFNVLATDATTGCSRQLTGTITITVNTAAIATPGSAINTCQSASPAAIALTGASVGGGATTGAWSITAGSGTLSSTAQTANPAAVTYTAPANYTGTVTLTLTTNDPAGVCPAVSSTRTINVYAPPTVTISPNYCVGGGVVQLTCSANSSYLWSTGATTQSINVSLAGNYTVTAYNAGGCSANASINVAQELVTNGNFSSGNSAFTTLYNYVGTASSTALWSEGTYSVGNNANAYHSGFFCNRDHTSGSGNFMIVNGSVATQEIWEQVVTVQPNTTYYFSAWATSLNSGVPTAQLRFAVNNVAIGTTASLPVGVDNNSGPFTWYQFYGTWNSGSNTSAIINILDLQTSAGSNDFGLDDISFSTLSPVTMTVAPTTNGPICAGSTLNLTPNLVGGSTPFTYSWTGPSSYSSSTSNPSIASTTTANSGVYSLTVTDGFGCIATASTASAVVNPLPTNIAPTAVAPTICNGTSTNIQIASSQSGVNYQLRNNATNANVGSAVAGTGGTINLPTGNLSANTTFNVYATNATSLCAQQMSSTVTVTVVAPPVAKTIAASPTSVCSGSSSNITVPTSEVGVNYQLRNNATNANVGSAVAGTGGTINLPTGALTSATTFNVLATHAAGGCQTSMSNTVSVSVNALPTVSITGATTICQGSTTNLSPTTAGTWASNSGSVASVSNGGLVTGLAGGTSTFTYTQTSTGCSNTTAAVTVNARPIVAAITGTTNVCVGSTTTLSNATSGGVWSSSNASLASVNTTGVVTGNAASTPTITYTVTNASSCVTAVSTPVTVSALPPNTGIGATSASICNNGSTTVYVNNSQNGVNYQLRRNADNSIVTTVAGNGGTILLNTGTLTSTTVFNVLAVNATTGCSFQMITTVSITVNPVIASNTITGAQTICSGAIPTAFTGSSPTGGNGSSYTYQWEESTSSASGPFTNATGTSNARNYTPSSAVTQTTWFRRLVTSGGCSDYSSTIQITINPSGQWVGGATGDWNTASNWCGGVPTITTSVVIPSGVNVSIASANAVAANVTNGGTITMTGAYNLTIGAGGTFTNNGTFNTASSTGVLIFQGSGTIAGTTTIKNVEANGALDFGTASTITGTFTIKSGGSVTGHSPTYSCPTATLLYQTGGVYARSLEWVSNLSGAGYPANVQISNNSTINFPAAGHGYVCYDLTIDAGSSLQQNYSGGSARLSVGRNLTINGTLTLGGSAGGDLYVGGNWTRSSTGVFNANDRVVTFEGTGNFSGNGTAYSTISAPASSSKDNEGGFGGEKFAHLWINKNTASDSVVLLSNITVTREIGFTRGTFSLRNSDVTLVSNSSQTADVAPITTIANVNLRYAGTGRFVVQRYVPNPTSVRSWRLLAAPFEAATAPTLNQAYQGGVVNPDRTNPSATNPWPGYSTHITGPGGAYSAANGFDQGTSSSSILYATNGVSSWVTPSSTTNVKVTDQRAWMLFVRGDRGFVIGNQYVPAQNTILEPKGKINVGTVTRPVVAGYQIMDNPYPSAISLMNVNVSGLLGKFANYYLWDPKMFTSYTQPGKWVSFTGVGTGFVFTSCASNYGSNGVVESGSGFMVYAPSPGTITFQESDKLPLSGSLIGIANRPVGNGIPMFRTDLYASNAGAYTLSDGVLNLFGQDFSNQVAYEDAIKLINFNTKESLSLLRDTSKLAIEKRAPIAYTDTIYYSIYKLNPLPYQFRFNATDFPVGMNAWLVDKYLNRQTPVSTNGATTIDFTVTADPLSYAGDRFKVIFKQASLTPLPVTFTGIKAWKQQKNIAVEWTVENELNIREYEIEFSSDGRNFVKVGSTPSIGNYNGGRTYNFTHQQPVNGDNFYRIRSIGNDGRGQYSQVVKVNLQGSYNVNVYPNPVTDGNINVQFNNATNGKYQLRLLNSVGQLFANKEVLVQSGEAKTELTSKGGWAKGIYTLEVTGPGGEQTTIKVFVQ